MDGLRGGGGGKNALFKIATKQYLGHLMILGGGGGCTEFFILDSRKAMFETLDDA